MSLQQMAVMVGAQQQGIQQRPEKTSSTSHLPFLPFGVWTFHNSWRTHLCFCPDGYEISEDAILDSLECSEMKMQRKGDHHEYE